MKVISISKLELTIVEGQDGVVVGISTFVDDYLQTWVFRNGQHDCHV
jgi:hypothetical protein